MRRSRLPLLVALLGAFFCVQFGWWTYSLWRTGDTVLEQQYASVEALRLQAEERLSTILQATDEPPPIELLRERLALQPELTLVPSGALRAQASPGVVVRGETVAAIEAARSSHRRMVAGEASVFAVLIGLGLVLLLRTARRESWLMLQQSNFLHAVTHELRTPLASLRLALDSLARGTTPERQEAYLRGAREDVDRLDGMIDNVLTVGRLDADAFDADPRPVDLSAAVEEALSAALVQAPTDAPPLQSDIPADLWAEADPRAVAPILRNLLENAWKYGRTGERIELTLAGEGEEVVLSVRDFGVGMDSAELAHAFDRFWRAGSEQVRNHPGSGLGLFLVRSLAVAQGGSAKVESDGFDSGSLVSVRWPRAVAP